MIILHKFFFKINIISTGSVGPTPHRHKIKGEHSLYSLWVNSMGLHKVDYISSKELYCKYYQMVASVQSEFLKLKDLP